jgi:hypothetical protein
MANKRNSDYKKVFNKLRAVGCFAPQESLLKGLYCKYLLINKLQLNNVINQAAPGLRPPAKHYPQKEEKQRRKR